MADDLICVAERMDVELTLQKISVLEKALQNSKTNDDKEIIQSQIDMLTKKLNPPEPKATRTESVTSSKSSDNPYEFEPISNEALQSRIDQLNNTEQFLLDLVTEAAGLKGTSDLRDLALKLHEDQYFADVSILRDNMTEFVPLTSVEIKKLEESYLNLPPLVRDMNEKQMGTTNVTDIVIRSFKENFDQQQNKAAGLRKMIPSEQIQRQSADENINTQGSWLFGDRKEKSRVDNYIENLLPNPTRKEGQEPTAADLQVFIDDVLDINTFTLSSTKPEKVSGGYVVRGYPRMENFDEMVEAIDKKLEQSSVANKIQFSYMNDPTPVTDDQMMGGADREPVLYVCGRDLSPSYNKIVTSLVSLTGLFFVFSLSCAFSSLPPRS